MKPIFIVLFFLKIVFSSETVISQRWLSDLNLSDGVVTEILKSNTEGYINLINSKNGIWLVAVDQFGKELRKVQIRNEGHAFFLEKTPMGLYVGGYTGAMITSSGFLMRITEDFDVELEVLYHLGVITSFYVTKDNRLYVGGQASGSSGGNPAFFSEIDMDGKLLYRSNYMFSGNNAVVDMASIGEDLVVLMACHGSTYEFNGLIVSRFSRKHREIWRWQEELGHTLSYPWSTGIRPTSLHVQEEEILVMVAGGNSASPKLVSFSKDGDVNTVDDFRLTLPNFQPTDLDRMDDGVVIIGYADVLGEVTSHVVRMTAEGSIDWIKDIIGITGHTVTIDEEYIVYGGSDSLFRNRNVGSPLIGRMTMDGNRFETGYEIQLYEDKLGNCRYDLFNKKIQAGLVKVGREYYKPDSNGIIHLDLEQGHHNIQWFFDNNFEICKAPVSIKVDSKMVRAKALIKPVVCGGLKVGITSTELIKCKESEIFLEWKNQSNSIVNDAVISLSIQGPTDVKDIGRPFRFNGHEYEIELGDLVPNENGRIKLTLHTPCESSLRESVYLRATISPRIMCNDPRSEIQVPDYVITQNCVKGQAIFTIKNNGADDIEGHALTLFDQATPQYTRFVQLKKNESVMISDFPGGNTMSLRLTDLNGTESILTESIEGCKNFERSRTVTGYRKMFQGSDPKTAISQVCMEVREYHTGNRVFETPRGLGPYHILDSINHTVDYNVRFINTTGQSISKAEVYIHLPRYINPAYTKVLATSHQFEHKSTSEGVHKFFSDNIDLATEEEIQIRIQIHLDTDAQGYNPFIECNAHALLNDSLNLEAYYGYHNIFSDALIDSISPFYNHENLYVESNGHTVDFAGDFLVSSDGNRIFAGTISEFGVGYIPFISSVSINGIPNWKRELNFEEGGAVINSMVEISDKIVVCGYIDNYAVPGNYFRDNFAFILALDESGNELWRRVLDRSPEYEDIGLYDMVTTENGTILLGGLIITDLGANQYLMEIDADGREIRTKKFRFRNEYSSPNPKIKLGKNGNSYIAIGAPLYYNDWITKPHYCMAKLDEDLNVVSEYFFRNESNIRAIELNGFDIDELGNVFIVGSGYDYNTLIDSSITFGYLVSLDDNLQEVFAKPIFRNVGYRDLVDVELRNDTLHMGGHWSVDTVGSLDLLYLTTDLTGQIIDINSIDEGANGYVKKILLDEMGGVNLMYQTQAADLVYDLQGGYWRVRNSSTVAAKNQKKTYQLEVFPNPSNDQIRLITDIEIERVGVIDLSGRLFPLDSQKQNSFSVSNLIPGSYLLSIQAKNGVRYYSKIMVQRD